MERKQAEETANTQERIKIEDLPVLEEMTTEEQQGIVGGYVPINDNHP